MHAVCVVFFDAVGVVGYRDEGILLGAAVREASGSCFNAVHAGGTVLALFLSLVLVAAWRAVVAFWVLAKSIALSAVQWVIPRLLQSRLIAHFAVHYETCWTRTAKSCW